MNGSVFILALAAGAGLAACSRGDRATALAECPSGWRAEWTADSSLSLCVEPGFARADVHSWQRLDPTAGAEPRDFFSVEIVAWPEDSASLRTWPPRLGSAVGCKADCITADSSAVQTDTWAGAEAHTETGLISGGLADLRRRPVFVSGWIVSAKRRGFAQGWAALPVTLDTLRQMLRTVRVHR